MPSEDHVVVVVSDEAQIPLGLITDAPDNPRTAPPEIEALAANIKRFGLLQPIAVRKVGRGRYELISGHRRLAAYRLLHEQHPQDAQFTAIAAAVRNVDDQTAGLMLASAQLHVESWTPIEEATVLERLQQGGRTLAHIGELLGKSQSWVSLRVRVHQDPVLAGYVQAGQLHASVAEVFLPVQDTTTRDELATRAVDEAWSQSTAKARVRALTAPEAMLRTKARQLLLALSTVQACDLDDQVRRELQRVQDRIGELVPRPMDMAA